MEDYSFLLEKKLKTEAPELHNVFTNCISSVYMMLDNYVEWFPTYTDHSMRHALDVIEFCNFLIGKENIDKMNTDEVFILLMSCYLHDSGMGISKKNFYEFIPSIVPNVKLPSEDSKEIQDFIRKYHHELSGEFVKKYGEFFELPSKEYVYCISQVARGHRKTDLYDNNEYSTEYLLPNGNKVCLPYLAALIRLADEIDLSVDRNTKEMYKDDYGSKESNDAFNGANAIKRVEIEEDKFIADVKTDSEEIFNVVKDMVSKAQETLTYCRDVVHTRTPFKISQETIIINRK